MITFEELKENGFIEDGERKNRFYFTKNGFNIVEHFGVSRYTFQIEGRDYKQEITDYGRIKQGFPDVYSEQLRELMGF